tara:strand:- start:3020 stop:7537 length:4518 start_codon:yes stop_codon:yes gene_type:complete
MTQNTTSNVSRILGIQFSILSPDEIRKGSVAEITSRDTYINNKPVINGLFDPRMGVLEPGLICPTDGLDYMKTPGYFGHIELARPMFYIQYLATIIKVLRCVCFKCSKLLIGKDKYKHLLELPSSQRWNHIFSLASKIKRCGEDNNDGCGCKQPCKIKKDGLATLNAEWSEMEGIDSSDLEKLTMHLTPEIVLKIFRRISDEDVSFMGFSPIWSRPDWMVCQVLAVPPPAVRPSVKHDSQQRSEDDISHIIVNIIKANKTLQEKMQNNVSTNVLNDWSTVLQYYVATLVDNKIPGVAAVAQRSGRPLKSIKERLNGKAGRVRGNLMGKRVDFSARSVITPDPNLSIRQLGVPIKVAMNITYPETVNERNKKYLTKLVQNGPDEYPGAKILERKNGENISLRYVDRYSVRLDYGDKVHRHMIDGDPILFNRQPTLHRMSMMCHIAKVLEVGNTFRMNVGDTKPYNADFDGDEMNLHMPQDAESAAELKHLAAVPYQIISPANNKSIVGIFQDSLLGAYRITRPNINFTIRNAMNLLMLFDRVNINALSNKAEISSFDLLSQILPPLSIKYKTKLFKDTEKASDSNNVLEINKGEYIRGQLDKGTLGDDSKGLIQRICNDFGNMASADFIDDLQNIVTEYMKTSAYSVGISDLIADDQTNESIVTAITKKKQEVKSLIDQTHLGIFENKTGKTDEQEFETQVNNILNAATSDAGKIGRESLTKENRFVMMVNAGSKGGDLNISQMISCLGQQNVDGKRIPYGFTNRTLPHFTKFDDSPEARGFVESSFISGLTPQELYFHAMGGRVGLIDTAVKTSQTGYIQRRLIKSLEDLKVEYDMTVRNNKRKIIQFSYGDDCIDPVKVEGQALPIVQMTLEEIYAHFQMPSDDTSTEGFTTSYTKTAIKRLGKQKQKLIEKCKEVLDFIIEARPDIVKYVFNGRNEKKVYMPVAFTHIINNVQGQNNINANSMVDITPLEAFAIIDNGFKNLENLYYSKPTRLFKVLYYYYLSPKELLMVKRFNRKALNILIETILLSYKSSIIAPGEMVGMIGAQSIGEPTTQMTLNTFHFAGVASKSNVTRGVPRIEEILSLSENPKNPSCTVHLFEDEEGSQERAQEIMYKLEHTRLRDIVDSVSICFDPNDMNTLIKEDGDLMDQFNQFEKDLAECTETYDDDDEKSKWIIRIELNKEDMLDRNITMDDVHFAIVNSWEKNILSCAYSDYNDDNLVFRIRLHEVLSNKKKSAKDTEQKSLDQSDEIYMLKGFQDQLLNNIVLRGIKQINKVLPRKIMDGIVEDNGSYQKKESWVLDTVGTNLLDLLALDYIDVNRTYTNDIQEIYRVLGIEAARQSIFNEITEGFDTTYINYHHISILCDRMTCSSNMISVFRHGINNDDIGPIAKASFEETPEMFLKAARHAELDPMRGVSANVMCGQEGYFGTSAFQTILDIEKMSTLTAEAWSKSNSQEDIQNSFDGLSGIEDDPCSVTNLAMEDIVSNTQKIDLGNDDDDYDPGF